MFNMSDNSVSISSSGSGSAAALLSLEEAPEVIFEYTVGHSNAAGGVCTSRDVTHVRFHSSVIQVQDRAFDDCIELREVIFNDGLRHIRQAAFWDCRSLQSIVLPSSVLEIDNMAFYNCCNLRKIVLQEGLRKIGKAAFGNCISLQSITLPSTVVDIQDEAFYGCMDLREVVILNEELQIRDNALTDSGQIISIIFPGISSRLKVITQGIYNTEIANKMEKICSNEIPGEVIQPPPKIEWVMRGSRDICVATTARVISGGAYWRVIQRKLYQITNLIRYYEIKNTTVLFELAWWKAKIDQSKDVNRWACRMEVPGPVKDIILQYAYPTLRDITSTCNQIFVRTEDEKVGTLDVEPTDTIMDIKNKLRDKTGTPTLHQRLFSFGTELTDNNRTLSEYDVRMETHFTLVVTP